MTVKSFVYSETFLAWTLLGIYDEQWEEIEAEAEGSLSKLSYFSYKNIEWIF